MPSTLIEKFDYDPGSRVLSVWLHTNARCYEYLEVPPEVYGAFRAAFSKGRFFNRHIRPCFAVRSRFTANELAREQGASRH